MKASMIAMLPVSAISFRSRSACVTEECIVGALACGGSVAGCVTGAVRTSTTGRDGPTMRRCNQVYNNRILNKT
jgi:hypothetical protein